MISHKNGGNQGGELQISLKHQYHLQAGRESDFCNLTLKQAIYFAEQC